MCKRDSQCVTGGSRELYIAYTPRSHHSRLVTFFCALCAFVLWQNVCPHEIIAKLTFNKCLHMHVSVCESVCKTFNELFASQLGESAAPHTRRMSDATAN